MTAEELRNTTIEVLDRQVEIDFKEELMELFSAASQGKFCYIFHNADFSCASYQFYDYLTRNGFTFQIRKYPEYGYTLSCSLAEIEDADEVKVSWK